MPVAGQRTHGTTFRALIVTSKVATPGAESAVYDCLVGIVSTCLNAVWQSPEWNLTVNGCITAYDDDIAHTAIFTTAAWRSGVVVSGVRRMNEVNARRARLVPGWVTVFGRVYHLGM